MSEPSLKYCTKRDGYDDNWDGVSDAPYIDLECRFSDGQKFAAVRIDAEFPVLADKIANFLNAGTSDNKRLDEILSDALAGSPETHVAILAREVVELRGEVAKLKQATAVVVPVRGVVRDLHGEPMRGLSLQMYCRGWDDLASRIRSIPADRVLGERQAAVDREELDQLWWIEDPREWHESLEKLGAKNGFDALRTQAGKDGAA